MFRFYVTEKVDNYFNINDATLKHMKATRVFDEQFICVYQETFFICSYENGQAKIIKQLDDDHEFKKEVVLAIGIIDTKRFEWLIQKATELGATRIIPLYTTNVSKKISGDLDKKLKRWNQIALNAAEQSFRNKALVVEKPVSYEEILEYKTDNKYIAYVKEQTDPIKSFPTNSLFLIGPEGGFTEAEFNLAVNHDFHPISLGKRILRAETAGMFVLSRVNE